MTAALIRRAIDNGYTHFICGGAVGFDMLASEIVLFLKNLPFLKDKITLEVVIPCKDQDRNYSKIQKLRYNNILKGANKMSKRDLPYNRYCMMLRNKYMVNNSSLVIAYFDGTAGGKKIL